MSAALRRPSSDAAMALASRIPPRPPRPPAPAPAAAGCTVTGGACGTSAMVAYGTCILSTWETVDVGCVGRGTVYPSESVQAATGPIHALLPRVARRAKTPPGNTAQHAPSFSTLLCSTNSPNGDFGGPNAENGTAMLGLSGARSAAPSAVLPHRLCADMQPHIECTTHPAHHSCPGAVAGPTVGFISGYYISDRTAPTFQAPAGEGWWTKFTAEKGALACTACAHCTRQPCAGTCVREPRQPNPTRLAPMPAPARALNPARLPALSYFIYWLPRRCVLQP